MQHLKEIMTSPVATIAPDSSLADAARKMQKLDIAQLQKAYAGVA